MEVRKTEAEDIPEVMVIIRQAQADFKANGINQWIDGYPGIDVIEQDRALGESYVLAEAGAVLGTAAISGREEITYRDIYDGSWLSDGPSLIIHRLAVSAGRKGEGLASLLLEKAEDLARNGQIPSIKIDTHRGNQSMQRLLEKHGYVYCGIIYLEDGSERFAYEKQFPW